ncbi:unnamed protein product [Echinostoma caproni]|uniref:ethanolamine kinase n=1 Tax=Echinostoma caproni TaxID=27848 RepID=A0A183A416_9TREM|nr:unnamed protein product [Echinostoma caproni]
MAGKTTSVVAHQHVFSHDLRSASFVVQDFSIDGPNDISGLEKLVLTTFPHLAGTKLDVHVLDDGLSNLLLRVDCVQQNEESFAFLVRINGLETNSIVDRELELNCMCALCEIRGVPKVYCVFNNGISYSYAKGRAMALPDFLLGDYHW